MDRLRSNGYFNIWIYYQYQKLFVQTLLMWTSLYRNYLMKSIKFIWDYISTGEAYRHKKALKVFVKILTGIFICLGFVFPTIALICLGKCTNCDTTTNVFLIVFAVAGTAFLQCGFLVNHLDIAPNHASTLMGITNGFSNILSLLAPLTVHYIVKNEVSIKNSKVQC